MTDPAAYIDALIEREGDYVADPADAGGATRWGITETVARAYGYIGDMRGLPKVTAEAIYLDRYWLGPKFDAVGAIDAPIAEKLLDAGVNLGPGTATRWLQRALNVLNDGAARFPDIAVDGAVGPMTLQALRSFVAARGSVGREVLLNMIRAQQSVAYIELAERRPANERFEYGWQRARASL